MADNIDIDSVVLDDLDDAPARTRNPSFAPSKPSRFRPKAKGGSTTATTAPSAAGASTRTPQLKTEPIDPVPIVSTGTDQHASSLPTNSDPKPDPEAPPVGKSTVSAAGNVTAMDVEQAEEEEEDVVVREIDVFFTPSPSDEDETKLYVMQYPLRPRWRPYDLAERCTEVRMMPKRAKMELDMSLDMGLNNFDRDYAEPMGIDKQTLSSQVAPCLTDYAVGVLRNNQIYLNPVHSVVQMRPLIRSEEQRKKRTSSTTAQQSEKDQSSSSKTIKKDPGDLKQIEEGEKEEESWVPLEFHPENSDLSIEYSRKMVVKARNIIDFKMTQSDYMGSFCPGSSNAGKKESFRRALMKLPLEERIKQWLTKASKITKFDIITYILAPEIPSSEILPILQSHADLIHGLWVTKSSLLNCSDYEIHVRDFLLLQFAKDDFVPYSRILKELGSKALDWDSKLNPILNSLTVRREVFKELKFRSSPDLGFKKRFPEIVEAQQKAWLQREEDILVNLKKFGSRGTYKRLNINNNSISINKNNDSGDGNKVVIGTRETSTGIGMNVGKSLAVPETRKFLLEALEELFEKQKVRTLQSVKRDLRERAKMLMSSPKEGNRNKLEAVLKGVDATVTELQDVLKQLSVHVGDVFVRKPPKLDNLRNVFIMLFRGSKKLKKEDIMERGSSILKREIKDHEYIKVVEDICIVTEDGGVILKSGD